MLFTFSSVAGIRLIFFIRYLLDISRFKKVLVQFCNLGGEKIILKVDIFDCEALKVRNLLKRELVLNFFHNPFSHELILSPDYPHPSRFFSIVSMVYILFLIQPIAKLTAQ